MDTLYQFLVAPGQGISLFKNTVKLSHVILIFVLSVISITVARFLRLGLYVGLPVIIIQIISNILWYMFVFLTLSALIHFFAGMSRSRGDVRVLYLLLCASLFPYIFIS